MLAPLLALALLVVLAGCLSVPSSDSTPSTGDQNVTVAVTGNSSASVYVSVHLFREPAGPIRVEYLNGSVETRSFSENVVVSYGPESSVRAVSPPEQSDPVDRVVFEGEPEWSVEARDIAPARAAVYVVRIGGADAVAAWGIVACPAHVERIDLAVNGTAVTQTGIACTG